MSGKEYNFETVQMDTVMENFLKNSHIHPFTSIPTLTQERRPALFKAT
jgi:hypothetical protein